MTPLYMLVEQCAPNVKFWPAGKQKRSEIS